MFKKNIFFYLIVILSISFNLEAKSFSKVAVNEPILVQDGLEKQWCPVCGMSLKKYYKTSHASTLQNGIKRQYCSLHCLSEDMKEYGIDTKNIKVVDASNEKLINAKEAFYLVGSRITGTMSKSSKLAFEFKKDAKAFKKKSRGKIVDFEQALSQAQASLKADNLMMQKKKDKKLYPKGKKLFSKKCDQNIDLTNYLEIHELKSDIKYNKLCAPIKEKQLHSIALYLWEVKRLGDLGEVVGKIEVSEEEKCPVCGMFTYKYPRWVAQIFYEKDKQEKHFSFDGVKDLMKFYFNSQKWGNYPIATKNNITKLLVTDYYSQKAIDGSKAFYVINSDILGPMGHELIPFLNEEDANTFKKDHYGKAVIKFDDIKENEVYKLD